MAPAPAHTGGGLSLCLATAGAAKALSLAAFTLVWTHSIEKVDWQEDWRVTPAGLELIAARVKGSGAGMEPPPEARLGEGWVTWQPQRPAVAGGAVGHFRPAGGWGPGRRGPCPAP